MLLLIRCFHMNFYYQFRMIPSLQEVTKKTFKSRNCCKKSKIIKHTVDLQQNTSECLPLTVYFVWVHANFTNYIIHSRLLESADPTATLHNMAASQPSLIISP